MKILLCSLAVLSFITLSAMSADAQHMYLGAKVGANLANESEDSLPTGYSLSIHPGFLAGAQFEYWFDDMWSLGAQVLYDQKGARENINGFSDLGGTGTADLVINYLEVPILVKATFGTGNFRPYVFAGPSIGKYLSNKIHLTATFQGQTTDTTLSGADSVFNSIDFSAVFGAGVSYKLSSGPILFLDAAYALGLVNVAHTEPGDNTVVKSRDIRIAVGILFPLDHPAGGTL